MQSHDRVSGRVHGLRMLEGGSSWSCAIAVACIIASGCTHPTPKVSADPPSPVPGDDAALAAETEVNDLRFHADLLLVARGYEWLRRADGTWWSPFSCIAPVHPAFRSKAATGGHGRKIYTLFVKDYSSYAALSGQKDPQAHAPARPEPAASRQSAENQWLNPAVALAALPQVIVKEAWTPVPSSQYAQHCRPHRTSYLNTVVADGEQYRACEQAGLFVIYRAAVGTEGTDHGWVYGTIQYDEAPDAATGTISLSPRVTSAGRVRSCMGCHQRAPHDRLFGMQPAR